MENVHIYHLRSVVVTALCFVVNYVFTCYVLVVAYSCYVLHSFVCFVSKFYFGRVHVVTLMLLLWCSLFLLLRYILRCYS